ncbi:MAG: carboxylase [Rhodospirillaceae bacterium]|nr:carboxylase [Rhodospirillaceae bacterium]
MRLVAKRGYRDYQEHLAELEKSGLLRTVDRAINKDTEMHPLVRWQFRGGIPEYNRKAWMFTNITDSRGRKYDYPVVVGALATTPEIYRIGMNVPMDKIGSHWEQAISNPIKPLEVSDAPCHEVVITGNELIGEGKGLDTLPIPISTPGYDAAPYFTATNCVTKDPETGIQNIGTYRAGLKSSNRLGVRMSSRTGGAGGYAHWVKYQKRGEKMPVAFVIGCPPHVAFMGPQKLPRTIDEIDVAGGLAGEPIQIVKCKTSDLLVPSQSELVIEGLVDTEYLEPEGPFGESHGHIALEGFNMQMEITAICMKEKPVIPSIISQVTPSESSVIKRVAYEPMFMAHLRDNLGIQGIKSIALHEPLTNLRKVTFLVMDREAAPTEVWRALYGISNFRADCGKYVIAVSEDIDPLNGDAILWSITYRSNPALDVHVLPHRSGGHGPKGHGNDATMLINATIKADMPPVALPKREYMENAKALWERLGLPELKPETPWHGYELGDWNSYWDEMAKRAAAGDYKTNGELTEKRLVQGVKPETLVTDIEMTPGKPTEE